MYKHMLSLLVQYIIVHVRGQISDVKGKIVRCPSWDAAGSAFSGRFLYCYQHLEGSGQTWWQASDFCRDIGGSLFYAENKEQMDLVVRLVLQETKLLYPNLIEV